MRGIRMLKLFQVVHVTLHLGLWVDFPYPECDAHVNQSGHSWCLCFVYGG
jgi:hypothetical protein